MHEHFKALQKFKLCFFEKPTYKVYIKSEIEVAPPHKLLTLLLTVLSMACMTIDFALSYFDTLKHHMIYYIALQSPIAKLQMCREIFERFAQSRVLAKLTLLLSSCCTNTKVRMKCLQAEYS